MSDLKKVYLPDGREAFLVDDKVIFPISGGGPDNRSAYQRQFCPMHQDRLQTFQLEDEWTTGVATSALKVAYCPVLECDHRELYYPEAQEFRVTQNGESVLLKSHFLLSVVVDHYILKKQVRRLLKAS